MQKLLNAKGLRTPDWLIALLIGFCFYKRVRQALIWCLLLSEDTGILRRLLTDSV